MQVKEQKETILRPPTAMDGVSISEAVKKCPPLDENSVYCNLLQCSHFSQTSVIAEHNESVAGFATGYLIPSKPDTLFIWQIAVLPEFRGENLALKMIENVLSRKKCQHVKYLETTITGVNKESLALFERVAKHFNTNIESTVMFDSDAHFKGTHLSEMLHIIGPLN